MKNEYDLCANLVKTATTEYYILGFQPNLFNFLNSIDCGIKIRVLTSSF